MPTEYIASHLLLVHSATCSIQLTKTIFQQKMWNYTQSRFTAFFPFKFEFMHYTWKPKLKPGTIPIAENVNWMELGFDFGAMHFRNSTLHKPNKTVLFGNPVSPFYGNSLAAVCTCTKYKHIEHLKFRTANK